MDTRTATLVSPPFLKLGQQDRRTGTSLPVPGHEDSNSCFTSISKVGTAGQEDRNFASCPRDTRTATLVSPPFLKLGQQDRRTGTSLPVPGHEDSNTCFTSISKVGTAGQEDRNFASCPWTRGQQLMFTSISKVGTAGQEDRNFASCPWTRGQQLLFHLHF